MANNLKKITKSIVPRKIKPAASEYFRKTVNFGTRYECPICNAKLKSFLPFGVNLPVLIEKQVVGLGHREKAQCPVCYSLDRDRLQYLYLQQKTNLFSDSNLLLHIAPEYSLEQVFANSPLIHYLSADIEPDRAMIKMDITKIQYPEESFDVVICNHVFDHIQHDTLAMSELYRVLVPGGWAVLQVPISLTLDQTYEDMRLTSIWEREVSFGEDDHVRIYAMDYVGRLENVGFEVELFDWTKDRTNFGGPTNKYNLIEKEKLFIARKPV